MEEGIRKAVFGFLRPKVSIIMSYRDRDPRLFEVIVKLGISLMLSLGISALAGKYLVQYLDPQHESRQKAKRGKQQLMRRLGRPDIQTNEHE